MDPFQQVAALLILAATVGALFVQLRQPLLVAFIAVGILAGPSMLGWVRPGSQVGLFAQVGIALLLFVVGLRLDLRLVQTFGPVALATGIGQVVFTFVLGLPLVLALGRPLLEALYVAMGLCFSSTIIVVKLLSDKREIDSIHGRIAVGFLIVQDLVAIVAMVLLSTLAPLGREVEPLWRVGLQALLLLTFVVVVAHFAARWLLGWLAHSQELLLLFAIAWALGLAAAAQFLGLSREVGAFLAGVSLASTPYRDALGARLVSLRDFLLVFFFVDLGARIDLRELGAQLVPAVVLSLLVLVGNPVIVMAIMGVLGYRKRTSFLAGLAVSQISEFSLILASLGASLGHVSREGLALITLVGLITIGASTYMILSSDRLYRWVAPLLGVFERELPYREHAIAADHPPDVDVILFGLGRYGSRLATALGRRGVRVLGVDFDPHAVRAWRERGLPARYGDAEDFEFPTTLPLERARWVISSIPEDRVSHTLVQALRSHGYGGGLCVTSHTRPDGEQLLASGADLVLHPFTDAAEEAARRLSEAMADRRRVPGPEPRREP